jgi:hypothetical protein
MQRSKAGFVTLCCSALLLLTSITLADTSEALKELEKAQFFPFGRVGVAGLRATSDTLFLQLASDANNSALFHSLWDKGTNEAKCYALLGLYWLKDPTADQLAEHLVSKHISVSTVHGCIVGTKEEVATFITSLKSGEYIKYYFPELIASQ